MGSREHVTRKRPATTTTEPITSAPARAVEPHANNNPDRRPALAGLAFDQRADTDSGRAEAGIQRRADGDDPMGGQPAPDGVAQLLQRRAGGGRALPGQLAQDMGAELGTDLSGVRVHADAEADGMAKAVAATAFTHGSDIYFSAGAYSPGTGAGQQLLAHEVSHVAQQAHGATGPAAAAGGRPVIGNADDALEREADVMGARVVSALQRQATRVGADGVQRRATVGSKAAIHRSPAVIRRDPTTTTSTEEGVTKTVTKNGVSAGRSGESKSETDTFDGATQKKSKSSVEGLAGAEAYTKIINESSDEEIKVAVEALARAGLFGEAEASASIERGKASAKASAKASGSVGASAGGKAGASKTNKGLMSAVEAFVTFEASIGAQGEASAEAEARYGPLAIAAMAKVKGFAGARVAAAGKAYASLAEGIGVEGSAEAMAGAEASGELSVTVKVGPAELEALAKGDVFAGASAAVKGKASIGLSGVEVSGAAEAFAGVSAKGKAKGTITVGGKTIISAKGSIGVSAGVGGKAKGTFEFKNGKLKIEGEIAAVLGIGGEMGVGVEIDFVALAAAIDQIIYDAFFKEKEEINRNSPAVERVPIIDEQLKVKYHKLGYDTMVGDFQAYGAKKAKTGDSGIKRARVQEILDKRYSKLKDAYVALETDQGIIQAAKDAFGAELIYIDVQAGQIRSFQAKKKPGQAERELAKLGKGQF